MHESVGLSCKHPGLTIIIIIIIIKPIKINPEQWKDTDKLFRKTQNTT